jgi:CBS domain-containing protein
MMKDNHIRRLPVVDGEKLVGIVTIADVLQAEPSSATTLSIFELNYLLAKVTIDQIMARDVVTVSASATIREAAKLMLDRDIGALPVIESDKLAGIITESDIFRVLIEAPEEVA